MINRIIDDDIEIWSYNPMENFNNIIEICYKIDDEDFFYYQHYKTSDL